MLTEAEARSAAADLVGYIVANREKFRVAYEAASDHIYAASDRFDEAWKKVDKDEALEHALTTLPAARDTLAALVGGFEAAGLKPTGFVSFNKPREGWPAGTVPARFMVRYDKFAGQEREGRVAEAVSFYRNVSLDGAGEFLRFTVDRARAAMLRTEELMDAQSAIPEYRDFEESSALKTLRKLAGLPPVEDVDD